MPITTTPPKVYTVHDIPRIADMGEYLSRVWSIYNAIHKMAGTPEPPQDMNDLNYTAANDIERVLIQADRAADSIEKSWIYSGEFESGGI